MEKIGKRLRAVRKEKHMTLMQVAKLAGVSHQAIGQYERGERNISASALTDLAFIYDVPSVSDLYKGTNAEERIRAEIDSEIKKEESREDARNRVLAPALAIWPGKPGLTEEQKEKIEQIRKDTEKCFGMYSGNVVLRYLHSYGKLNEDGRLRLQEIVDDFSTVPKYQK